MSFQRQIEKHVQSVRVMIPACASISTLGVDVTQSKLDHQALNLVLEGTNLAHKITLLVGGNRAADHSAGDTASTSEGHLGWNINVGCVLVLAQQRQVKQDCERRGVCGQDDNLTDTTVESLSCLVGTLLQLARV